MHEFCSIERCFKQLFTHCLLQFMWLTKWLSLWYLECQSWWQTCRFLHQILRPGNVLASSWGTENRKIQILWKLTPDKESVILANLQVQRPLAWPPSRRVAEVPGVEPAGQAALAAAATWWIRDRSSPSWSRGGLRSPTPSPISNGRKEGNLSTFIISFTSPHTSFPEHKPSMECNVTGLARIFYICTWKSKS